MAPTGRVSTDILSSVTVLKGPSALVAGVSPYGGGQGGVVIANTKRADKELTRVSANYDTDGFYKSGFDVARRFGTDQEFGARVSANYGQGEPYRVCRRVNILRDYPDDKIKIYP